jgi:hypothetical protein
MNRARAASTTTLLIAAVMLSGCSITITPPPGATTAPASSTPAPDTETPAPTVEPVALSIPTCDALLSLDEAKSLLGPTTVFLEETPANEYTPWFAVPAVSTAMSGVTEGRACWWGIRNSDSSFYVVATEIDPATRASIDSALTAEGYSSAEVGARTVRGKDEADGGFAYRAELHQFSGNLWIVSNGVNLDVTGIAADTAFAAIQAANPTLGL